MIAELKRLLGEATKGPWENKRDSCDCPYVASNRRTMLADINMAYVPGKEALANAALIVALRNNAEALLAVCEAAEKLVAEWEVPDCDCPAEGHICGWPKVIALKMALARLKEGKG